MTDLLDFTYEELENFVVSTLGEPRFRAQQLWQWIWQRGVCDFEAMSNVSLTMRAKLAEHATMRLPELVREARSEDGTRKLLLRLHDGALVETVLIPGEERGGLVRLTQCLSCQVGCAMGCTFCSTGTMGFTRNMTPGEILGQILVAKKLINDVRLDQPLIRNLVFMGMGEPLLNLPAVLKSLRILNHEKGLRFSPRRITVSTCALPAGLQELGESGLAFLAVSLHAPNQAIREQIMPKAARWPFEELVRTLESYPLKTREHITLEYLLLGGINDQPEHAHSLVRLVRRLNAKLNLIAYNPSEGMPYKAPTQEAILQFQQILWDKRIVAILRKSKGQDIQAACGQLCVQEQQNTQD